MDCHVDFVFGQNRHGMPSVQLLAYQILEDGKNGGGYGDDASVDSDNN